MRNMLATVAQMMQCYSNTLMQQNTPKKAFMSLYRRTIMAVQTMNGNYRAITQHYRQLIVYFVVYLI